MKKYILLIGLSILLIYPRKTFALEYINNNGVTISEENYNNLRKIYSEKYISVLDQDQYDRIMAMNLDFSDVQKTRKYIKTEYNQVTGEVTETLLTEAEYNNVQETPKTRATVIETAYKYTELALVRVGSENAYFTYTALWKIMPAVRSFDVIGVRFSAMKKINGTQQGKQVYVLNGVTDFVQYNFNGTNIKNFSNGFGISMNLLNSNVSYLECTIDSSMDITSLPAGLFTSYQHAVQDVSLATSQDYTLGVGLGDVFVFNNNIGSKYDGMQGTYDYFSH
ncbi:MAG: hypothetical protein E7167_03455 [Firmicutes bacterium]|nr:hypothetical protein [Bacillota bacterium]